MQINHQNLIHKHQIITHCPCDTINPLRCFTISSLLIPSFRQHKKNWGLKVQNWQSRVYVTPLRHTIWVACPASLYLICDRSQTLQGYSLPLNCQSYMSFLPMLNPRSCVPFILNIRTIRTNTHSFDKNYVLMIIESGPIKQTLGKHQNGYWLISRDLKRPLRRHEDMITSMYICVKSLNKHS